MALAAAGCTTPSLEPAPLDARLSGLYQRTCASCHATGAGGAPQTHGKDWEPRRKKGLAALVTASIQGLGGMPPGGLCAECQKADFELLIRYMAAGGTLTGVK